MKAQLEQEKHEKHNDLENGKEYPAAHDPRRGSLMYQQGITLEWLFQERDCVCGRKSITRGTQTETRVDRPGHLPASDPLNFPGKIGFHRVVDLLNLFHSIGEALGKRITEVRWLSTEIIVEGAKRFKLALSRRLPILPQSTTTHTLTRAFDEQLPGWAVSPSTGSVVLRGYRNRHRES